MKGDHENCMNRGFRCLDLQIPECSDCSSNLAMILGLTKSTHCFFKGWTIFLKDVQGQGLQKMNLVTCVSYQISFCFVSKDIFRHSVWYFFASSLVSAGGQEERKTSKPIEIIPKIQEMYKIANVFLLFINHHDYAFLLPRASIALQGTRECLLCFLR